MSPGRITLLPSALLSAPVFFLSLLWPVIVQIGESSALGGSPSEIAVRLLLLIPLQILMFAFPFMTWHVICPRVTSQYWTPLLLGSILVGAAIRGVALGISLFALGISQSPEFVFRIVVSVAHMGVVTVILWFLVSEVQGLNIRRRQLLADRDQLLVLQHAVERDLEQLGDRAAEEIRLSLMQSLGGAESNDSHELRERLRITIDEVVRPLSHQLAAQQSAWNPPQPIMGDVGVNWPLAMREGLNPARIHPVLLPLLLLWLGLPIHFFQFTPTHVASYIAITLMSIPVFWVTRKVAIQVSMGRGPGFISMAFVVAVVTGALVMGTATLTYMSNEPEPFVFVIVTPILALLVSGAFAVAEAARDQDMELEAELTAITADLRWALARTRERYRQRERALAHALHGRVQASLSAAFLRLDRAMTQGLDNDALLDTLNTEIRAAVAALDFSDTEPDPLDKVMSLTQSNWSGAVALKFSCSDQVREILTVDPMCARSVNDLIPELVFNSVRHGSASSIDIEIAVTDDRTMRLTVVDNGHGDLIHTSHGLGSTLLNEASIGWTRTHREGRTTTTCSLPYLDRVLTSD
jgi:signal transduction histidine kinase